MKPDFETASDETVKSWHKWSSLGDGTYITLQEATNFAETGWLYDRTRHSLITVRETLQGQPSRRPGSLRFGTTVPVDESAIRPIREFYENLSEAGRWGLVRFVGVDCTKLGQSQPQDISEAYFVPNRWYGLMTNEICEHRQKANVPDWKDVQIDRASFADWLSARYPAIAALDDALRESRLLAMTSGRQSSSVTPRATEPRKRATPSQIEAMIKELGAWPGFRGADVWRIERVPNVSRDSFREECRNQGHGKKPGPKGPRRKPE